MCFNRTMRSPTNGFYAMNNTVREELNSFKYFQTHRSNNIHQTCKGQSPWPNNQCVGLLVAKAYVRIPGQLSKTNYEKLFFDVYLSADFWQKL